MDTDQQVRLSFLEESEEYFEQMEQVLLGLPDAENPVQQLDVAMRAAHSLKGGAGMMGFMPMADVAHRLEDFLKIVRARSVKVDTELETLLLGGVDCLKDVRQLLADGAEVDETWKAAHADPLFAQLRDRLGDLSEADENKLLSADEDIDVATLVFNTGVEESLDAFEASIGNFQGEALRQALMDQCDRLSDLGLMGEVDNFVALCQSVRSQVEGLSLAQLPAMRDQALALWQRTQGLVMLGRLDNLPTQLDFKPDPTLEAAAIPTELLEAPSAEELNAMALAVEVALDQSKPAQAESLDSDDLSALQAEMAQAAAMALEAMAGPEAAAEAPAADPSPTPDSEDMPDLSQLQAEFAQIQLPTEATETIAEAVMPAAADPEKPAPQEPQTATPASAVSQPSTLPMPAAPAKAKAAPAKAAASRRGDRRQQSRGGGTLRVAADELKQINNLFGSLILERNAVNLRQQQLDGFTTLLQERMQALEAFNIRLRQWYDQSSSANDEAAAETNAAPGSGSPAKVNPSAMAGASEASNDQDFDALEMDQYSDLHLLASEQMETVVKLQEVTADIRLGLQEMGTALQSLNGTTRQLQGRITRTQMRPFSDIVGRFPRVIRDLSVKYDKKVKLDLQGESTLFERIALDVLTDPLTHLLRNSFDHGIETAEERRAAGKSAEGTIMLRASQLGNRARIVLRDDGHGINLDKIRDRMRKHDIPEEHIAGMTKQELLSLIFDAGFSTAEKVTELSGRGVGMDVVRTNLNKVGGDIKVDTEPGQGTTFTIDIPLSLSVLRIMLLEQQEMVFAVPVTAVDELLQLTPDMITNTSKGPHIQWQDQEIPVMPLEQFISFNGSAPITPLDGTPVINHTMVLVVRHNNGYYAVPIQRYWGEQEVATRPVASPLPLPQGFVGATVLGDGRVVPLVDLPQLVGDKAQMGAAERLAKLKQRGSEDGVGDATGITEPSAPTLPTVLVVDDSVHLRRYLTLTLEKAGYMVEQARDGREAVDRLVGGLQVQAVLCDIEMPRLDGYGVLDEIKSRPEFQSLPISMLTSRSSEKHRKLAMNLGASAYFGKPYNDQELLKTLAELIGATV